MVDDFPKDLDNVSDIEALRAMMSQLIVTIEQQTKSIEKLSQTIEQQTQTIEQQTQTIELKDDEIRLLKKMLFGNKSERIVPVDKEVKRRRKKDPSKAKLDKEKARQKRKKNAAAKKKLKTEEKEHRVSTDDCCCPICGGSKFSFLGFEESVEYEFVPAHFKRVVHKREKKACSCGGHIVIADGPVRVADNVLYGPGMHAHVVVSKCLDSMPLYRSEKQFERLDIPIARSTLCDMFHRTADLLRPIYERIMELIPEEYYVNADETRVMVQAKEKTREAWMWVFIAGPFVAYAFSASRSGETPMKILGDSKGILQVDQYSGYNQVTTPDKRTRAGCMGHARRKFFEAKDKAPELAEHALEQILELYIVEYDAAEMGILGTDKHLAMRQARSKPILEGLKKYLEEEAPSHLPKGPVGKAIGYFSGNQESLERFLTDPKIPLDNNVSERQLRLIALGRKNYLFVGNDDAGRNLAVNQTLVASCVNVGVNPQEYLADVIIRIQTHPMSRIDELLPHNWKPPPPPEHSNADSENN
jgi:transposase